MKTKAQVIADLEALCIAHKASVDAWMQNRLNTPWVESYTGIVSTRKKVSKGSNHDL